MNVSIIPADESHVEILAPLFNDYRRFYSQADDPARAREFLSARLANGDSTILLAMDAARGVGFTQLYPSFSSVSMRPIWILNDLYVALDARRYGVGRRLLDAAVAFGRSTSAMRLVLATGVENHAAQELYSSHGWELDRDFHHYSYALTD